MTSLNKKTGQDASLHEYYEEASFNPVYANLETRKSLDAYQAMRKRLFEYNLRLPIRLFDQASVLEFGPASGENALAFARWGSRLRLVEPVKEFLGTAERYFAAHGLRRSLEEMVCETFEGYQSELRSDFVVAEGFIYHVGDPEYWIPRLVSFVKDEGFVVFSHAELSGFLIELLQAKCLQVLARTFQGDVLLLAHELFDEKWGRVHHTRSFESWARDNLLNPLVNNTRLNSIVRLQEVMVREGMMLWSSWPALRLSADVSWIKKPLDTDRITENTRRSAMMLMPSFLLGEEVMVTDGRFDNEESAIHALQVELEALSVPATDFNGAHIQHVRDCHGAVETYLASWVQNYGQTALSRLWQEIDICLLALSEGDRAQVAGLFHGEGPLARCWGSPNMYTVWHKIPLSG